MLAPAPARGMRRSCALVLGTLVLAVLSFVLVMPLQAQEVTVSITPDRDATLIQRPQGNKANGSGRDFHVGRNDNGGLRRGLLHFDVASAVPPGSVVHSAELVLRLTRTKVGHFRVSVHRVLQDWSEGPSFATSGGGVGADSMEGDVTWIDAVHQKVAWQKPGGDFEPWSLAALGVIRAGFYTFDHPMLTAEVQSWVDGSLPNYGFLLMGKEETGETSSKRFASRESGTAMNRPTLNITFTPPAEEWCKRGTVDLGASGVASDVVFVNGSAGDAERVVDIAIGEPIHVRIDAPAEGPDPAPFVLYLHPGTPTDSTVSPLPAGVGDLCFPSPLSGGEPMKIWNNIGHEAQLGPADYPSQAAPSILIDAPDGADRRALVTMQGILFDQGSAADVAASVTNAVTLDIR